MIGTRKLLAAAGVLAAVCTVAATAPAAQAVDAAPAGTRVTQTPLADGSVRVGVTGNEAPSPNAIAAVPSTSPAVEHVFLAPGGSTICKSGYACAFVPYSNGFYVFKFVHYDGYSVSNWLNVGPFLNNQTGGAGAKWDNVNGRQLGCVAAGTGRNVDWNPVWRVRLTASGC
ncbi:hypothetical protein [Kribbella sp. NPDC049227]|uniref:hypothetical protein n=1 Tax=Kribbella sp. NPDC049227 TaxID=3364113 RepID=UPI0037207A31